MKKKWIKKSLLAIVVLLVAGAVAGYIIWNKPHADAKKEKGEPITANQLVNEFSKDEKTANTKYLDKALSVKGEVLETGTNQDSLNTVTLKSGNEMVNVYCTLTKGEAKPTVGETVAIKGFCVGMLSDVTINEAIIDNKP